ncbi:MAG: host attachment protein [Alphaproteobacteria bacterium]
MTKRHPTTWILVCDGARGRIFSHESGTDGHRAVSRTDHTETHRRTRELGSDRPGRTHDSAHTGQRHAMEPRVDWHRFEKTRFAQEMAAILDKAALENVMDRLILVAPPQVIGDLRKTLGVHSKAKLAGELSKDLTNLDDTKLAIELAEWVTP